MVPDGAGTHGQNALSYHKMDSQMDSTAEDGEEPAAAEDPPPPSFSGRETPALEVGPASILEPMIGQCGDSSAPAITLMQGFKVTVKLHGKDPALCYKAHHADPYKTITWQEYYDKTIVFAKSLIAIDFKAHASVNILGYNSPEWFYAHIGCIAAGGMGAGIYTTNLPEGE